MLDSRRTLVLASALALLASAAFAQTSTQQKGKQVTLRTRREGWPIVVTYFESQEGKEAPVAILLHGEGGNRRVWTPLANRLQRAGFAVVAADLRKHGDSKPGGATGAGTTVGTRPSRRKGNSGVDARDYERMFLLDLPAIKKFVYEQHQQGKLNMRKMAVVASDVTVPVAAQFALADWLKKPYNDAPTLAASTPRGQDVQALVLLSPERNAGRLVTSRAVVSMAKRWPVSFQILVCEDDAEDRGEARKLHRQITGSSRTAKRLTEMRTYPYKFRGTEMLGRRRLPVEQHIVEFLQKHVQNRQIPWRDRKPRI